MSVSPFPVWVRVAVLLVASVPCPAHAGTPTEQEIRASQVLAAHLRKARSASKAGNLPAVRKSLRDAMRVGSATVSERQLGYYDQVRYRPVKEARPGIGVALSGCSTPFFEIPLWMLVAQVRSGDADGARQTAGAFKNADHSLVALCLIARLQAGKKLPPGGLWQATYYPLQSLYPMVSWAPPRSPGKRPTPEQPRQAQEKERDQEAERHDRDADYSLLLRPRVPANRAEAIKTLRHALPYAILLRRRRYSLEYLLRVQKEIGDTQGAAQTARLLAKPT